MTKVAVISADGRIAGHVIKELVARGYDVTGFGRRDENTTGAQTYIKKICLISLKPILLNLRSLFLRLELGDQKHFLFTLTLSNT